MTSIFIIHLLNKTSFSLLVVTWCNNFFCLMFYQATVNTNSYYNFPFFFFLGTVFVGMVFVSSIISSHVINHTCKICTIFTTTCSRILNMIHTWHSFKFFYHYSSVDLSYIIYHQIYIYNCIIYILLMFLVHLFLQSCGKCLGLNLLFYWEHILY